MINYLLYFIFISQASALQIVTADFTPYQIQKKDRVGGITTDIVRAVLADAKLQGEIRMYPWPRAYKMALREPDIIIYSIIRTPDREKLFKWIGVIAPFDVYFWKLKNRKDITVNTIEDAKRYISAGVFEDVKAGYLKTVGFKLGTNLEFTGSDALNIKKLFAKRIDLLPYDELSLPYKVAEAGYDSKNLQRLIRIEGISHNLYIAASLNTSDETVAKIKRSLENFKKTKNYKKIQSKIK